jgi:hypothetical protein
LAGSYPAPLGGMVKKCTHMLTNFSQIDERASSFSKAFNSGDSSSTLDFFIG